MKFACKIFIDGYLFENILCKMSAILSRGYGLSKYTAELNHQRQLWSCEDIKYPIQLIMTDGNLRLVRLVL